ncbi:MAG: phospholipase D family protein [Candidatus Aenigmatarchaeota archaeon]
MNLEVKFVQKLRDVLSRLANISRKINAAVAYVTNDGLDILDEMGLTLNKAVIGSAFNITEPSAIQRLLKARSEIRIAEVVGEFHPKIYLIPYDDSIAVIVGSSNLTRGGLEINEEANIILHGKKNEPPHIKYFRLF